MPNRSLEREGLGEAPNPSLCGGSTVPLDRSLWPVSGSTPRFTVAHHLERHQAGSQRPDAEIRFFRFEVHGCLRRRSCCQEMGREEQGAANRCGGTSARTGSFKGGEFRNTPAHARGRGPDPLAVGQPCSRRAPGLRSRQGHHATCRSLVKKRIAKLSSKPRIAAIFFQGHVASASVFQKRTRVRAIPWNCLPGSAQGRARKGGAWESTALLSMSEPPCSGLSWLRGGVGALGFRLNRRSGGRGKHELFQASDQHGPRRKPGLAVPSMHSALLCHSNRKSCNLWEPFSRLAQPAFGERGQPVNGRPQHAPDSKTFN